jgi:hypothetical protein
MRILSRKQSSVLVEQETTFNFYIHSRGRVYSSNIMLHASSLDEADIDRY